MAISRETGMAFLGPVILGVLALAKGDGTVLDATLAEADELLAAGSISHNHLLFRRDAIEACLQVGAWDGGRLQGGQPRAVPTFLLRSC